MTAMDLLEEARNARRTGDLALCLSKASATVSCAEREHVPEAAYHAYTTVGRMYMSRGEPDEALSWYRWALDAALSGGLTIWVAGANHDLALALRKTGNVSGFKERAALAFRLYQDINPRHPSITGLWADMKQFDADRNPGDRGALSDALSAWKPVPESMKQERYRLTAATNLMRLSATLRLPYRYSEATDLLERTYARLPHLEYAGAALTDAAYAAMAMKEFERASSIAERAMTAAECRGEHLVAERAREAFLAAQRETVMA